MNTKISILGAGSWGTALAILLSNKGFDISLWEFNEKQAEILNKTRNLSFLPKIKIPEDIFITSNLKKSCQGSSIIIFAVPSQTMREVAKKVSNLDITKDYIVVSASKGLELVTLKRMSEILEEEIFSSDIGKIAVLSGPSHAEEVS